MERYDINKTQTLYAGKSIGDQCKNIFTETYMYLQDNANSFPKM